MLEHIEEYLVGVGADIDRQSFDTAMGALRQLESGLRKLKYAAAPMAIAAFITAVGKAAVNTIRDVAKTDMEYQKLAKDMWVTKESAKALKVAMDAMGASQDDIAWIPELRQQFGTILSLLDDMGIRRFSLQGWEADDLLGTLSLKGAAAGAVRALDGTESVMTYTGEPSWDGFKLSGAPRDVEE